VLEVFEDPLQSPGSTTVFLSGYHVLIGMLLDDNDPVKQDILREFWRLSERRPLRNTRIRRLALVIKNSSKALSVFSLLGSVSGLVIAVFSVVDLINRYLFGNSQFSLIATGAVAFLVIIGASSLIGTEAYTKLRNIYADTFAALRSRIASGDFEMYLSRAFHRLVGFVCSTNMSLFLRLLTTTEHYGSAAEICMRRNNAITSESAKYLLSLMVRTDIDASTRSRLFRWLCSVNIKSMQSIHSNFARQASKAIDQYNSKRLSRNRDRLIKRKRRKVKR